VLKLKTMLERLDNDDLPNKCVVLTADDAYQSMPRICLASHHYLSVQAWF
jgi:hypothetical protein